MLKKKKICFPLKSHSFGGSHKSVLIIIKNIDKKIFDSIVVIHRRGIIEKYLKKNKIKFVILPLKHIVGEKKGFFNFLNSIFLSSLKIIIFVKKQNISTVHTNDIGMHLTWSIPSFLTRTKLIWHCRNYFSNWPLYRFFSIFPKKILCISRFVKNSIPNFSKNKSVVTYDPVNLNNSYLKKNKLRIQLNKKISHNNKTFVIGCVSNFTKQKRPFDFLLLAEKLLKRSKQKFFFIMVGSLDKYKKRFFIDEVKKREINKNFLILDYVDPIENIISAFDLTFAPAYNEGLGRVLIESMSVKTPIIANNSGGHKEIIQNNINGWLYNTNNIEDAANVILDLINKKKLKSVTNRAFDLIKEKHNYQKHINQVSSFY